MTTYQWVMLGLGALVEIYGRDHYVKKDEFVRATDSIRADIKALGAEIKNDLKDMQKELSGKPS
ncbi:hypothetical protein AOQ73_36430 [Bradyrhizobium pachyrhizi]|uniref:hypothetical protein n=1 Tax=Bradyrhizobium pachyrhizi TaxID=280333 RepID=UPI000704E3D7|nr:hypothetical protein [Bradyrhizobium pachyrhizi]KRP85967.1 hypothetical protein AOQ73_36430 [Bradyrhizobium pachyrhizi]